MFKNPKSWTISLYSGLAFAPITAFGGLWGIPFISLKYDMFTTVAAKYISLIFIGFAIGAPVFAKISSQLKKRKSIMAWGTSISLLLIIGIIYLPKMNHFALAVLLFSFGFFISSFLLSFTVIHEIHLPMFTATSIGFMNACNALIGALLDPLIGLFLDLGWKGNMIGSRPIYPLLDYQIALVFLPLLLFFSLGFLYFVKETNCHQHHEKKETKKKSKLRIKKT